MAQWTCEGDYGPAHVPRISCHVIPMKGREGVGESMAYNLGEGEDGREWGDTWPRQRAGPKGGADSAISPVSLSIALSLRAALQGGIFCLAAWGLAVDPPSGRQAVGRARLHAECPRRHLGVCT